VVGRTLWWYHRHHRDSRRRGGLELEARAKRRCSNPSLQQGPPQEGRVLRLSFDSSLHPPYGPDSCVRASEAPREGFQSIALSKKVCHSEGGSWRVSRATATATARWWLPWGAAVWAVLVFAGKPKHQEFCILYKLRLHFYVGIGAAGGSSSYTDLG
jgi:hypothetical protein